MSAAGERSHQDAALAYARAGWPVFPVLAGCKEPATKHGFKDATTDPGQISRWWRSNAERNIGIATGAPGPDVLDVDHHGERGSGFAALNRLKREGLVENPCAVIRTPSGGLHLYFTADPEHPQGNGSIARQHIDFRGAGGYVVAPPSAIGGRPYEVVKHEPSSAAVDFAAIRSLLDPQPARRGWQPRVDGQPQSLDHLVRYVAECTDHVNDRLYWAACRMAEAGHHDRLPELIRAAYDAGEDRRGQAEKTVESALRATAARAAQLRGADRPFEREREAG
jgi:Bifunctional DNA primase/polymerase, N-terminal